MMDYTAFGKRIREERLKLNLTQEKLAEAVDLSTAYIGQIERGERSLTLENLIAVANELGVTVDYLIAESFPENFDRHYPLWYQLVNGRSDKEKALAVNMVKLMFNHLDGNV